MTESGLEPCLGGRQHWQGDVREERATYYLLENGLIAATK